MSRLQVFFFSLTVLAMLADGGRLKATPMTDAIPWMHDIDAALEIAADSQRLVLVHFWTPDCLPCRRLEATTFNQPEFAAVLTRYYVPVKINARQDPQIAERFGVDRWPTDVILTPNGQMAYRTVSPQVASHYVHLLKDIALRNNPVADRPTSSVQLASGQAEHAPGPIASYAATPPIDLPSSVAQSTGAAYIQPAVGAASNGDSRDQVRQASHDTKPRQQTENSADIINHYVTQPFQQMAASSPTGNDIHNTYVPQAAPQAALPAPPQPAPQLAESAATLSASPPATEPTSGSPSNTQLSSPNSALTATQSAAPVMGLDGYCPVTLLQKAKWVPGDRRWGVRHRGRVYLFHSAAAQQEFLANPDRFSPAISGYDPVRFADENRYVAGSRRHGVVYQGQIFLFDSEDSLMIFQDHAQRYTESVQQAMRMSNLAR